MKVGGEMTYRSDHDCEFEPGAPTTLRGKIFREGDTWTCSCGDEYAYVYPDDPDEHYYLGWRLKLEPESPKVRRTMREWLRWSIND